jgi:hypothetical protein
LKKAVRPEWNVKVFVLNLLSRYDSFSFQSDLILQLKKPMQSVLSSFNFATKRQADLQIMIDEWVTLLTNEHVGVVLSFIPTGFDAMISLFKALT